MAAAAQILAGLRFLLAIVQQLLHKGLMRESAIYQDILAEGRQEGLQQELNLILRLLPRRVRVLPAEVELQLPMSLR